MSSRTVHGMDDLITHHFQNLEPADLIFRHDEALPARPEVEDVAYVVVKLVCYGTERFLGLTPAVDVTNTWRILGLEACDEDVFTVLRDARVQAES